METLEISKSKSNLHKVSKFEWFSRNMNLELKDPIFVISSLFRFSFFFFCQLQQDKYTKVILKHLSVKFDCQKFAECLYQSHDGCPKLSPRHNFVLNMNHVIGIRLRINFEVILWCDDIYIKLFVQCFWARQTEFSQFIIIT